MKFEFSEEDRKIILHTFSADGSYIGQIETNIPANQGIPNRTVFGDLITDNNPVWSNNFRRVEYSDEYGAEWFIDESGDKISVADGKIKSEPPTPIDGYETVWTGGKYEQIEDHRGETWFSTLNGETIEINDLGPVPFGYTDNARPDAFHKFEGTEWIYKKELEEPAKIITIRKWRDEKLSLVVGAIDKNRIDKEAPDEFKSSKPIDEECLLELYALRIILQNLPEKENFPFCDLPGIPEWLN